MASSGNTWCKKLMHKRKVFVLKRALGNETSVMAHCIKAKPITARSQERLEIIDKPVHPVKKVRDFTAPMKEGWAPRPFGRRGR